MKKLILLLALMGCSSEPTVEEARAIIAKAEQARPQRTLHTVRGKVFYDENRYSGHSGSYDIGHWFVLDSAGNSCETTPALFALVRIDSTRISCVWTRDNRLYQIRGWSDY